MSSNNNNGQSGNNGRVPRKENVEKLFYDEPNFELTNEVFPFNNSTQNNRSNQI